jgi:RNA polymerase sigma factor (TIGR02999 family)
VDGEITQFLQGIEKGDPDATDRLLALVYDELRQLAAAKMARESSGQTLQATALVHDAWIRLGGDAQPTWQNRAHFFGAAAEAMRRILVDRARKKRAIRHGGDLIRADIDEINPAGPMVDEQILAVHEALDELGKVDARKAELVKLRYFVGMTITEASEILGISEPTAKRWWRYSRAWLYREIQEE